MIKIKIKFLIAATNLNELRNQLENYYEKGVKFMNLDYELISMELEFGREDFEF